MTVRIFGIEIERKTDILALIAVILSSGGLLMQAVQFVKGSDILVEPPRQIFFNSYRYSDGEDYLRISANLIYLNKGSPGYDDIIKSEIAYIEIGDKVIILNSQEYVDSSYKDEKLVVTKISDAYPVQIKSGIPVAHETYFAPWPSSQKDIDIDSNYIKFTEFISLLESVDSINVKIKVATYNGENLETVCQLNTSTFLRHLKSKNWSAPVCAPNKANK